MSLSHIKTKGQEIILDLKVERRRAYQSAQDMLAGGEEAVFHLVALELRRCIEAIVYEKLWNRKEWLPADIAHDWRPPQAFDALLVIDPDAEHTETLAVAPESTFGVMPPQEAFTIVGTEARPGLKLLKDNYHKLGSYLHVQSPFLVAKVKDASKRLEYYRQLLGELEPLVQSTVTFNITMTEKFTCHWCKRTITVNASGVESDQSEIQCLGCQGKISIKKDGDKFILSPQISWAECPDCKSEVELPTHKLAEGYQFTCACGSTFEIRQGWRFAKIEPVSPK